MEKRRNSDDLAVVKAAAWAWYERSSCTEGKLIREFDTKTKKQQPSRPSRYKLEAMKSPGPAKPSNPVSNSLLDAYEIESISKRFDNLIDSKKKSSSKFEVLEVEKKKEKKKKERKKPVVLCGAASDVVVTALRVSRRTVPVTAVK